MSLGLFYIHLASLSTPSYLQNFHTPIDFRKAMDEGKILICNLSKGKIGEENSSFLGSLIAIKLQLSAMERVDLPEERRREIFPDILSEARKYRLCLTMAHQ